MISLLFVEVLRPLLLASDARQYRGGYDRTEKVGGLNLRIAGAVRYPHTLSSTSISSNESDIPDPTLHIRVVYG